MKQKLPFILEITWLVIMVFSLVSAIIGTVQTNFSKNIVFYVIAVLAVLMYTSRRYLRKAQEKNQARNE